MKSLLKKLFTLFHKKNNNYSDTKSNYIFYKIVDVVQDKEEYYKLQCINTSAIFQAKLTEVVFDTDILHGLHPVQACFVGIEYAKYLKKNNLAKNFPNTHKHELNNYSVCRYGDYELRFQDRKGNINFINKISAEEFLMDPCDIVISKELVQNFDAIQAFYIGILAGIKLSNSTTNVNYLHKRPNLWLVK